MKMVNCYDCKKEIKFIDAKPLWNRIDKEPDFLCIECSKDIPRINDESLIFDMLTKIYIRNNQPERSKREDHKSGCGALNSMVT